MNLCAFLILTKTDHCFPLQHDLADWDCVLSEVRTEVLYTLVVLTAAILKGSLSSKRFKTVLHNIPNVLVRGSIFSYLKH